MGSKAGQSLRRRRGLFFMHMLHTVVEPSQARRTKLDVSHFRCIIFRYQAQSVFECSTFKKENRDEELATQLHSL